MNEPNFCNIPKTQISVWNELCSDLNLPAETISLDIEAEDEDSLKFRALLLWDKCDKCESEIAPILYVLCKKIHAPGKKDDGFNAWLKANGKPKATAYRWIRKYANEKSLELPFQLKAKATRDNMGHSTVDITQNIYTGTWWEQRKAAVEGISSLIWSE